MSRKSSRSPSKIKHIQDTVTFFTLPADGDALTIIPQTLRKKNHILISNENREGLKKQSEHIFEINQRVSNCPLLKLSSNLSNSIRHAELTQQDILDSENQLDILSVKSCGFPYYRSYKSCGRFDDIVLVKDAEVSCTILNSQTKSWQNFEKGSSILRGLMLSRMKIDSKDLGNITRKIISRTKDMMKNFSLKKNYNKDKKLISDTLFSKKEFNSSFNKMKPVAMEYKDETGSPCLKLRLVKSSKFYTLFGVEKLSCWNIFPSSVESELQIDIENEKRKPIINEKIGIRDHVNLNTRSEYVKKVRQIYPKGDERIEFRSSSCSISSINDFPISMK